MDLPDDHPDYAVGDVFVDKQHRLWWIRAAEPAAGGGQSLRIHLAFGQPQRDATFLMTGSEFSALLRQAGMRRHRPQLDGLPARRRGSAPASRLRDAGLARFAATASMGARHA